MNTHFHVDGVHVVTTMAIVFVGLFIWNKTASYLVVSGGATREAIGTAMGSVTH